LHDFVPIAILRTGVECQNIGLLSDERFLFSGEKVKNPFKRKFLRGKVNSVLTSKMNSRKNMQADEENHDAD